MDIVAGVLPVACGTPVWCWQHSDPLVAAHGFCRDAGGVSELAHRQGSFHGCQGHSVFQDSPLPGQGEGEGEGRFQPAEAPSPPAKASPPRGEGALRTAWPCMAVPPYTMSLKQSYTFHLLEGQGDLEKSFCHGRFTDGMDGMRRALNGPT